MQLHEDDDRRIGGATIDHLTRPSPQVQFRREDCRSERFIPLLFENVVGAEVPQ